MRPFSYARATDIDGAIAAVRDHAGSAFLAGGTTEADLVRQDVLRPGLLVDINDLPLNGVKDLPDGGLRIGALARMSDVAQAHGVTLRFPVIWQTLLLGVGAAAEHGLDRRQPVPAGAVQLLPPRDLAVQQAGSWQRLRRRTGRASPGHPRPSRSENTFSNHDRPIARPPGSGRAPAREGLIMKTPPAQVTGRSPGEEHPRVAGRHHRPGSGGPAGKRLAAGMRRLVRDALRRDPDDRWAAVFGRIAGYSFAVAVVTGVLLLPLFRPSMATVVYRGSYRPLDGVPVSQAYRSVLAASFDVRGGLLIRQVHHWSADLFVAAICLRLLRAFFRGRFSGRALPDWLIWVALLPAPPGPLPARFPGRPHARLRPRLTRQILKGAPTPWTGRA